MVQEDILTHHDIYFHTSQDMSELKDNTVDLVVTSPPYPMINMWDEMFRTQNPKIGSALDNDNPRLAFELMHQELDKVWKECWRVMKDGAFLCINIGDATRNINGEFAMYSNSSRIISVCSDIGFICLPSIIWKKVTNSPNKFMGSGMLPCGAYVTMEHEFILIFRKGSKRPFETQFDKAIRKASSYFWEERNVWFSDIWELTGTRQVIDRSPTRDRNASFPLELPFRLINMFSMKGDVVLDPFMGLGTTVIAAIMNERNSIGYEIDSNLRRIVNNVVSFVDVDALNEIIDSRYMSHREFIETRQHKDVKHYNEIIGCGVITEQEKDLFFRYVKNVYKTVSENNHFQLNASYRDNKITSNILF